MQMGKLRPKVRKLYSAIPNINFVEGLLYSRPLLGLCWEWGETGEKTHYYVCPRGTFFPFQGMDQIIEC